LASFQSIIESTLHTFIMISPKFSDIIPSSSQCIWQCITLFPYIWFQVAGEIGRFSENLGISTNSQLNSW